MTPMENVDILKEATKALITWVIALFVTALLKALGASRRFATIGGGAIGGDFAAALA